MQSIQEFRLYIRNWHDNGTIKGLKMLLINCPFCKKRNETEFVYGGPVGADRPDPNTVSDQEWVDFLTLVPNPTGPVYEKWWHARGCGEWFIICRDTTTHEIIENSDEKS